MADTKVEEIKGFRNLNPALEALKFNYLVNEHLESNAKKLLETMHETTEKFNSITALLNEFNIRANNIEHDKKVTFIDFENSKFQETIDSLYDDGILEGERVYKFETKHEIDAFKSRLEAIQNNYKNKNQEPPLRLELILKFMEQMCKIAKTCCDDQNQLEEKSNTPPR